MSQPTGLFSVSRPRQTLGNIQNFSGIPVPQSAIKRASSSNDLRHASAPYTAQHVRSTSINHNHSQSVSRPPQPVFQRSSSGSNLAANDAGMSTVRRSAANHIFTGAATTHRQSLAPTNSLGPQTPASTTQQLQRRSSIYSRPSNHGPIHHHQSFFTPAPPSLTTGNKMTDDPRPVRDRTYQSRLAQDLLTYLSQHNFELETRHALTHKSVTSPTQKDFTTIFTFLYRRIDPGYRFQQKSIDAEIPPLLKTLRYPYEHKITRSQLQSVGGQNWPLFLGLLHWMMQLATMLDNFSRGVYDDASAEAGIDVASDRIVFRFLFGAYQDWVGGSEDDDDEASAEKALEPHVQTMAAEFERINGKYVEELKVYEAENAALKTQWDDLEKGQPDIAKLDKHFHILQDDKQKFEEYNHNVEGKIEKYDGRVRMLEAEIQRTEAELVGVEEERVRLQEKLDGMGLNMPEVDRMNVERERLAKSTEEVGRVLEEVRLRVSEKEAETGGKREELEAAVKRYNGLAYTLSLIPSAATNARGVEYELTLTTEDNFSSSTATSARHTTPSQILNTPPLTLHPRLSTLRKEIQSRRAALSESDLSSRDFLDSISDALSEKNTELESLNHRLQVASTTYNTLKESTSTSHTVSVASVEKLEKELSRMREGVERGVVELEQREMEVGMAWEAMQGEVGAVREELHGQVERCLEEVVRWKVKIQRGLEEVEGWVGGEVEVELEGAELGLVDG